MGHDESYYDFLRSPEDLIHNPWSETAYQRTPIWTVCTAEDEGAVALYDALENGAVCLYIREQLYSKEDYTRLTTEAEERFSLSMVSSWTREDYFHEETTTSSLKFGFPVVENGEIIGAYKNGFFNSRRRREHIEGESYSRYIFLPLGAPMRMTYFCYTEDGLARRDHHYVTKKPS